MKIAVASMNGQVAEHFGHCETFLILNSQTGKVDLVANPGHKPGFLPNFLADLGVNVLIAGGIGSSAIQIFNSRNIDVVTGGHGDSKAAAEAYAKGELKASGNTCHEDNH